MADYAAGSEVSPDAAIDPAIAILDDRPSSSGRSGSESPSSASVTSTSISIDTNAANCEDDVWSYSRPTSPVSPSSCFSPMSTSQPRPNGSRAGTTNGPLYLQAGGNGRNVVLCKKRKTKDDGIWQTLSGWFVENQLGFAFNLLALLFLTHMFIPKARPHTRKFFNLSYYNPRTSKYGVGGDDMYIISFCVMFFTGLRAGMLEYVLAPLGKLCGVAKPKDVTRFSEQAYMILYYLVCWPMGVYIYANSKYFLNLDELWTDWPDREVDAIMKVYVLMQWAFWLQQVIVINIEERRKDHWQMLSHHFITIVLVASCYRYHHTRIGNLILILMDIIDIFFPLAKCLKYMGMQTLCDITFGVFMVSWIVARHILYPLACWSVYRHTPNMLATGCFYGSADNLVGPVDPPAGYRYLVEPFFDSQGHVCYNQTIKWAFLTPLLLLQGITILWFTMIIRVAIRVIKGESADDVRSDSEEDEAGEADERGHVYEEALPLEEEVGVDALDLKGWERRAGVSFKRATSATGVSLPGHIDRRELLGRIGCEKHVE